MLFEAAWQSGSVGSWQSLLVPHMVVHAAYVLALVEQLKQVVPAGQGTMQSGTKVVHVPCRQVTPGVAPNAMCDPSSVVGCPAAQPHAGKLASHCASSV
jgi:hypothetical protein